MFLPPYLQPLTTHKTIAQMQACANLARQVFANEAEDINLIDKLRGQLLRTLKESLQYKAINNGLYYRLRQYALSFFTSPQPISSFESLPTTTIQAVENAIIIALEGLAENYPIKDVDPIDLNPIDDDDIYFLSLQGRKYRLESLVSWIKFRKAFIYPDNNDDMFLQDIAKLKQLCTLQGVSLEPTKSYSSTLQAAILEAGFSVEEMKDLVVPELHKNHINALQMLTTKYHFSHIDAITELQKLNYEQAEALNVLYEYGLRGDHLRNLSIAESEFSAHHTAVLQLLVHDRNYDIDMAVNAISDCDIEEVQKFYSTSPNL
ncbi:hypothetical protein [Legionella brunensis]|uniref:Uncharacterized protein n=1 Tax=Legionella brunensis TaxID=29422 RepID=A0A0W0S433_9GAMM|nr:hypothetical protein [Legionella brunensis]KTC78168.1 hypothetical protein Lbru_2460 [Legionella brunensis]